MGNNGSKRRTDTEKEKLVTEALICFLKEEYGDSFSIKRVTDKDGQLKGTDFVIKCRDIFYDDEEHRVDAKAAIDYPASIDPKNSGLPTFAMELASIQNDNFRIGWAISDDPKYYSETEYYCFIWITVIKARKIKKELPVDTYKRENIEKVDLKFIHKDKLKAFITNLTSNSKSECTFYDVNATNVELFYSFFEKAAEHARNNDILYAERQEFYCRAKENLEKQCLIRVEKGRLKANPIYRQVFDRFDYKTNKKIQEPKLVYTASFKNERPLNLTIYKQMLDELAIKSLVLPCDE